MYLEGTDQRFSNGLWKPEGRTAPSHRQYLGQPAHFSDAGVAVNISQESIFDQRCGKPVPHLTSLLRPQTR